MTEQTMTPNVSAIIAEMRDEKLTDRAQLSNHVRVWANQIDAAVAALIARNAELEADNKALREAVKLAKPYIATHVTACHGEKCRELNCESCFSDAHENAEKGRNALEALARAEAGHG